MIERLARQLGKEERDLLVLEAVLEHQPVESDRLAELVAVDEHKARHSVRMLEDDGLLEPTPDGVVTPDDVDRRVESVNANVDALIERVRELKEIEF